MNPEQRRTLRALKDVPSVGSTLGTFVSISGSQATVNVWDKTVVIPYVGQYPAQPGETVQLERRNGRLVATGPANPRFAGGSVVAVTSPKLTVLVDGETDPVMLPYDPDAYPTPAVNDDISIDWFYTGGRVSGRLSTTPVVVPPPTNGGTEQPTGRQQFTALWSKSYRPNPINSDEVIFGQSYTAAGWGYGPKIRNTIPDNANINLFRIYLVCTSASGATLTLGKHTTGGDSAPGAAFTVTGQVAIPGVGAGFAGWVDLLALGLGGLADYLKANDGGVGTAGPGYRVLKGLSSDGLSGALDIGWG